MNISSADASQSRFLSGIQFSTHVGDKNVCTFTEDHLMWVIALHHNWLLLTKQYALYVSNLIDS